MDRREFINLAGALAVGVAGAETLKDLMVKGPSGILVGDAFAGTLPMNRCYYSGKHHPMPPA